jgi:hypothetical protein
MNKDILEEVKDTTLYKSFIADFKRNELLFLLLKDMNKDALRYSSYRKLDLKYGPINKAAYDKVIRAINDDKVNEDNILSNKDIIDAYRDYLLCLKSNRESKLKEAKRKVKECDAMLELISY